MKSQAALPQAAGDAWHRAATAIVLLWLAGSCLRITVLAVPPVIPLIHRDLGLGETGIGILSALPLLMFAWAAVLGSLLIARFGAQRILVAGLAITAIASAARGAANDAVMLDLATLVMGLGISVMQPGLPPMVRAWLPHRIGFGTSVYANGWLIGEVLAVWLTIPFLLPLLGGSWRLSLVTWSLPVAATVLLILFLAPRSHGTAPARGPIAFARWWPQWRNPLLWRLGFIMGSANVAYFATNNFLPDYLGHFGRADLITSALTALNLGQLPASFLMMAFAPRLTRHWWPFAIGGASLIVGVLAMTLLPGWWIVGGAAFVGFACATVMVLVLTLPPLFCAAEDVPRTTAGIFAIGYNCSVVIPILAGLLWDATGWPYIAFVLIGAGAAAIILLPTTIDYRRPVGAT